MGNFDKNVGCRYVLRSAHEAAKDFGLASGMLTPSHTKLKAHI